MPIHATRAIVRGILSGALARATMRKDSLFGFDVPERFAGVPDGLLDPRSTWTDVEAYDRQARRLAAMFVKNFEQYDTTVQAHVVAAGPSKSVLDDVPSSELAIAAEG
jgi:phosphoenolpyruvate carboxykinase (ATP)